MFQICLCGTQPGYPHAADCPFPYYGRSEREEQRWCMERFNALQKRAEEAARPWTLEDILRNEG